MNEPHASAIAATAPALSRRTFLGTTTLALTALATAATDTAPKPPPFLTRGIVLYPFDLTLTDWPARAQRAGLTTIALHAARRLDVLLDFIRSDAGQKFLADCARRGVAVEYELHAMGDLLSREYFAQEPAMFRQNLDGRRVADANCCPSSSEALDIIARKAVEFARVLKPTTHRYFYWPDDGRDWCHCARCRGFSASEQALLVGNHILRALRQADPRARVSHLAYGPTIEPPRQVRPEPGTFLEFAPIRRSHEQSYAGQSDPDQPDRIELLDANLAVFEAAEAQVLEYWLDVSRFSDWKRPARKLPWRPEVCRADVAAYRRRDIRHITSFACFIDADYVRRHGELNFLDEYGHILQGG
jgi:hypothetical protein